MSFEKVFFILGFHLFQVLVLKDEEILDYLPARRTFWLPVNSGWQ
jgi:hypothetical protein